MRLRTRVYSNTDDDTYFTPDEEVEKLIEVGKIIINRLKHIKTRMSLLGGPGTLYVRGFNTGKLHRLIAERYFLETLLELIASR